MDQIFKTCSEDPIQVNLNTSLGNSEALVQQIIGQIVLHPNSTENSIREITFINEKFRSLLLTTPVHSLVFRYGPSGVAATFDSLKCAGIDSEGKIMISHLWKCTSGFLLVDDCFTFEKFEELRFIEANDGAPLNRRRITFLGRDKKELFVERVKCDITVTHGCLVMFTTHDGFTKNLVSCFYIDGRDLTKLERAMSVPLPSSEDNISVEVFGAKDSDIEQDNAFDSASQSTVSKLINTPFGTSIIDEDRGIEVTLSTDEREASLKQREQEMDNRERDIAEQERNLKQRDLLLADLQSPEKIDIAHCGAAPSGGLKELEQRLLKLAAMKSSADYPSPMTTKNFLTQMTSSKSVNDGIEIFEVPEAELAHYDKSIQNREADARAREIALAGFQLTMEKRVMALDLRENSAAILEAKLQNREKFVQAREQEINSLNRSLSWRDGLRKKRETELAAHEEANSRLRDQLDADRETLDSREAVMEREFQNYYERYDTYPYDCYPYSQ
ncbi:hypothetical protein ACHAQE_005138 [Botrytis cinerea]